MVKRISTTLLAGVLLLPAYLLAADRSSNDLKFLFITCSYESKFFTPVKKGMTDAAEMFGVQCDFIGTDAVDMPAQAAMLRQAVKDGYDGVAFSIIHPEAFDSVIQETIDAGVPVVGFNVDDYATPNARLSSVNQRLYESGKQLGQHVIDRIPENSRVLMTVHDAGVSALEDRLRGIQEILKTKNIEWKVVVTGNDALKGTSVVADALKMDPDIRVVLNTGQADTEATGRLFEGPEFSEAYWSAGFDLSPKILELIRDRGIFCTIDQQPYVQGFYPVVQLTLYCRYGIQPYSMDAGACIIDSSNVAQVMNLCEQQYR